MFRIQKRWGEPTLAGRLGHCRPGLGDDNGGGDHRLDRAGRGEGGRVGVAGLGVGLGDGADSGVGHNDLGGDGLAVLVRLALVGLVVPVRPADQAPLSPDGNVGSQGRGREGDEGKGCSHGVCVAGVVTTAGL